MTPAEGIRARLAAYLGAELEYCRVLDSGWETTIFEFALAAPSALSPELPRMAPLVLRLYGGARAAAKAAHEARIFDYLAGVGYPVPHPYRGAATSDEMGAPFLIMERVTGGPLFTAQRFPAAFRTFSLGFLGFVRTQVRLHRLPPGPLPQAEAPLLDRMLATVAERVAGGPLPGLADALASLSERAGRYRSAPHALVHMDYHPQNVIVSGMRVTGVVDWVSADGGDRHLDAAATSAILATSAMERPRWMRDNLAGNSLRRLFTALYLPAYHALAPMELGRFRYCQAVASLFRLSTFGMMKARGAEAVGYRPEAIAHLNPDVIRLLSRYATRKTGVPTAIG